MGKLNYLIIHCSDTPEGREVSKKDIEKWHMSPKPKGNGWDRLGYSDMIHLNGELENLTPYNEDDYISSNEMTWGAAGINNQSRHICVVGGRTKDNSKPKNTLNQKQAKTLANYCKDFVAKHPEDKIGGHYHFSDYKSCPNFDVEFFLRVIGIPEQNIYKS